MPCQTMEPEGSCDDAWVKEMASSIMRLMADNDSERTESNPVEERSAIVKRALYAAKTAKSEDVRKSPTSPRSIWKEEPIELSPGSDGSDEKTLNASEEDIWRLALHELSKKDGSSGEPKPDPPPSTPKDERAPRKEGTHTSVPSSNGTANTQSAEPPPTGKTVETDEGTTKESPRDESKSTTTRRAHRRPPQKKSSPPSTPKCRNGKAKRVSTAAPPPPPLPPPPLLCGSRASSRSPSRQVRPIRSRPRRGDETVIELSRSSEYRAPVIRLCRSTKDGPITGALVVTLNNEGAAKQTPKEEGELPKPDARRQESLSKAQKVISSVKTKISPSERAIVDETSIAVSELTLETSAQTVKSIAVSELTSVSLRPKKATAAGVGTSPPPPVPAKSETNAKKSSGTHSFQASPRRPPPPPPPPREGRSRSRCTSRGRSSSQRRRADENQDPPITPRSRPSRSLSCLRTPKYSSCSSSSLLKGRPGEGDGKRALDRSNRSKPSLVVEETKRRGGLEKRLNRPGKEHPPCEECGHSLSSISAGLRSFQRGWSLNRTRTTTNEAQRQQKSNSKRSDRTNSKTSHRASSERVQGHTGDTRRGRDRHRPDNRDAKATGGIARVSRMKYTTPWGKTGWYTGEVKRYAASPKVRPHGRGRMRFDDGERTYTYSGVWTNGYSEQFLENETRTTRRDSTAWEDFWNGAEDRENNDACLMVKDEGAYETDEQALSRCYPAYQSLFYSSMPVL